MPAVVRQHQLAAILRGRGWTYRMLGRWSDADARAVRAADGAWLEILRPWDSDDANEKGIWSVVLTGEHSGPAAAADVALAEQVAGLAELPAGDRAAWWPIFAFGPLSNQGKVRRVSLTAQGWSCDTSLLHAGDRAIHLGSARVVGDPGAAPGPEALARAAAQVGTADRGLTRVVALALEAVEAADDLGRVRGVVGQVEDGVDVEP